MLRRSFSPIKILTVNSRLFTSVLLILVATGCACSDNRKPEMDKKDRKTHDEVAALGMQMPNKKALVTQAEVDVQSLTKDPIHGKIVFLKVPEGIKIIADVEGLKPGKHGFHVHEFGDCGGHEGGAAGGHFNPTKSKHGGPDSAERHVGDLGNLEADSEGYAHYERVDKLIAFEGENSILGRSIVIHADPDDYTTQPTGASGVRIACGIIESVSEQQ